MQVQEFSTVAACSRIGAQERVVARRSTPRQRDTLALLDVAERRTFALCAHLSTRSTRGALAPQHAL